MSEPDHFQAAKRCYNCAHAITHSHHCSCCSENDTFKCTFHDFIMDVYDHTGKVCDDWKEE